MVDGQEEEDEEDEEEEEEKVEEEEPRTPCEERCALTSAAASRPPRRSLQGARDDDVYDDGGRDCVRGVGDYDIGTTRRPSCACERKVWGRRRSLCYRHYTNRRSSFCT